MPKRVIWSRDELILALDLYVRFKGNPPGVASAEVQGLSKLLRQVGPPGPLPANYRNADGVYMKAMNFRNSDPAYLSRGLRGLDRGNRLEPDVFAEFAHDPQVLSKVATTIRLNMIAAINAGESIPNDEDDDGLEAPEGRLLTLSHRRRERSRKLVKRRKERELKLFGKLACAACGFQYETVYGEQGRGYIEAHHTQPLHSLEPGAKTRLKDLILLCANCHRMVHAVRPWHSLKSLQALLEQYRRAKGEPPGVP